MTTRRRATGSTEMPEIPQPDSTIDLRDTVRARYAAAATRSAAGHHDQARALESSCCSPTATPAGATDEGGRGVFGAELYAPDTVTGVPDAAVAASLGCGVPTAVADLRPGQTVLDLGSGAGAD